MIASYPWPFWPKSNSCAQVLQMVFSLSGFCLFNWQPLRDCSVFGTLRQAWSDKDVETLGLVAFIVGLYTAVCVGLGYTLGTGRLGQREILLRVPDTSFSFQNYGAKRVHAVTDREVRSWAIRPSPNRWEARVDRAVDSSQSEGEPIRVSESEWQDGHRGFQHVRRDTTGGRPRRIAAY